VKVGITPDGRYAVTWQGGDSDDGWSVALAVKPGEKPRWGVERWWRW